FGEVAGEDLDRPGHREIAARVADAAVVEDQALEALFEMRRLEAMPVPPHRPAATDPDELRAGWNADLLVPDLGFATLEMRHGLHPPPERGEGDSREERRRANKAGMVACSSRCRRPV